MYFLPVWYSLIFFVMQAEKSLFATTPVLGRYLRNRAVERLFSGKNREAVVLLAGAVEHGHPEADEIFRRLLLLRHADEPEMHSALWNYWRSRRFDELLKRLNADGSLDAGFRETLVAMPESDWGNGMLFMLWSLLDRDEIAGVIESGGRHAPSLEMDALFGLVRAKPARYLSLEDPDYSIFEKAWLAASGAQKQRISLTVLNSRDSRLVAAYDHAVRDGRDPQLVLEAFKLCGDHDALLDRLQGLPFSRAIEVIAFWEQSDNRPATSSRRAVVDRAVALYRELAAHLPEPRSSALPGARDIFSFWREHYRDEESIQRDLLHPEPFRRAGALFAGAQRGLISRSRLQEISVNGTWPEKLALHHLVTAPDVASRSEHVLWLRPQEGVVGKMLAMCLPGSHEECALLDERLERASGRADRSVAMQRTLLQMFTLMQGYFLRGVITVDSNDDAAEKNAVETEDIPDAEW